jgi:TPR repeat protein
LRREGRYWHKEYESDYAAALYLTEQGTAEPFSLTRADAALKERDFATAFALCERQYRLGNLDAGFRLAYMYTRGLGVPRQPQTALTLLSDLADRGELKAWHQLGLAYEFGDGVATDYAQAATFYRQAAAGGLLHSLYALGTLSAKDRIRPRNDIEGLSFLLRAVQRASDDPSLADFIREDQPAQMKRFMERMSAADIETARTRASRGE